MVWNIDSARVDSRPGPRSEPVSAEVARMQPRREANDEDDVRLSLSEAARRLSGASPSAEAEVPQPGRAPAEQLDPAEPGERNATGMVANEHPDRIEEEDSDRVSPSRVAAYRAWTRSRVGARISIRA